MSLSGTDSKAVSHLWEKGSEIRPAWKPGRTFRCAPADREPSLEEAQMRRFVRFENPFRGLFGTNRREQYLERYELREHRKGRPFVEVLEDPYVRAWSTPEERARLLERPEVVAAVGEQAIADLRALPRMG
jgi:hypothetical protein